MLDRLPCDIVLQIFSRLPVESLARVKWVCKALLSLTSGPIVANMLASRGPRILILTPSSGLKSLDCSSKTSFTDEDGLIDLDFPPSHNDIGGENTRRYIRLVGACNGLVGVSLCDCPDKNDRNFFLWNPSTGFHKKLPDFLGGSNEETKYMLGFGYDSTINDYKVIIVRETLLFTDLYFYTNHRYSVLETKTDSWRVINYDGYCENDHDYSYLYGDLPRGYFLNGVLHWRTSTTILALDLTSEKFSNVPMPKVQDHVNFTTLSVLDGCLCLVSNSSRDDRYVELWTMKEYGAQSSWQKLFRVTENYGEISFNTKLRPLCFTTTGDEEEALFFLDNNDE